MTFMRTVRGVEIEVHAINFDGDPSVGIEYGPQDVYAETLDGKSFELTEEEVDQFTIEASIAAYEDDGPEFYL